MFRIALVIAFWVVLAAGAGPIYKWVDEAGNVHYSDQPPPEEYESEELILESAPSADDVREAQERLDTLKAKSAGRSEKRKATSAAEEAERAARVVRDQRCLERRMQLAVLQEQRPVYRDEQGQFRLQRVRDPYSGKREYIDDATRASEVARVHQEIESNCQDSDDAEEQDVARRTWIRSELCATHRAELELLEQRGRTVPRETLELKREVVNMYCGK